MRPSERWPALLMQLDATTWQRAVDLAQSLGVSERTVYRDVQELVEAGVPLQGVPGKGYRLPDSYLLDPITLTADEAVMLILGSAYAAQNFGGRYRAAARAGQMKLRNHLPPDAQERAFSLQGSVQMVPPSAFGNPAEESLLRHVRRALLEERTVRLRRRASSPQIERFRPYGLVRQNAHWRVVGLREASTSEASSSEASSSEAAPTDHNAATDRHDATGGRAAGGRAAGGTAPSTPGPIWQGAASGDRPGSREGESEPLASPEASSTTPSRPPGRVASIRLDDIDHIELTDERFERPSGYSTPSGAADMPRDRTVRVVFSAEVTPLVQVASSMQVETSETTSDGRLLLTLRVIHELEVMPWLLSWGSHVEVLHPQALSRRLAHEARAMAEQYAQLPALLDTEDSASR